MSIVDIAGIKSYSSSRNPRTVDVNNLTECLNFIWSSNGVTGREGSSLFKNSEQAGWAKVAKEITYKKRDDNFYWHVVICENGRVFTINSDHPSYGIYGVTWTEIDSPSSTTPALAANALSYDAFVFNNILFLADNSNAYYSWDGVATELTLETNPPDLGSANIVKFIDKSNRLLALDDAGRTHLSAVNDGTDFTTASGGGSLSYGRVEGLIASNVIPFGDDVIITTQDILTQKFQSYSLTGIQFLDPALEGTQTNQFEVKKLNSIAGIIGASGQEIAGDTIGLSPRGFVSLGQALNVESFADRDYISFPIKEIISQINFARADLISSTVDVQNGWYLCAVPFGDDAIEANIILVYDFLRSSPQEGIYRWSIWTFENIQDIGSLSNIAGNIHASSLSGALFVLNDGDTVYDDEAEDLTKYPINLVLKTAAIGGSEIGIEKDYKQLTLVLTNLVDDFYLNINSIRDEVLISQNLAGDPVLPILIQIPEGGLQYDTPGIYYDDFNYYDSLGVSQRVLTVTNRGGRATSMQWILNTQTAGITWGLGGFSVELNSTGSSEEAGANNYGNI